MLERPDIADATVIAALRDGYGLDVTDIAFMPLGNDSAAWTYRALSVDGDAWFVKLRRAVNPAALALPRLLADLGFVEVVAPRETVTGEPWVAVLGWAVLAYPFIDAPPAMDAGLDTGRWRQLGAFAARLHATVLPNDALELQRREDFRPKATDLARSVDARVARLSPEEGDEIGQRLAESWTERADVIRRVVEMTERLADRIRRRATREPYRLVPCHADLHIGNVLVVPDGIRVVDWDEVLLAPPERDLMFMRGSPVAGIVTDAEATAFENGYGSADTDPLLIAYYRADWAVQDLADFARRTLMAPELGPATRVRAAALFESVFHPGGEVDVAFSAAAGLDLGTNDSSSVRL